MARLLGLVLFSSLANIAITNLLTTRSALSFLAGTLGAMDVEILRGDQGS